MTSIGPGVSPRDAAPDGRGREDDIVGWMFFGFSRPRRWVVALADFHEALDAFDRAIPAGVKVMRHEPITRRNANSYDMSPGEVVELRPPKPRS